MTSSGNSQRGKQKPAIDQSEGAGFPKDSTRHASFSQMCTSPRRTESSDSFAQIRRSDSMASLRALAHLIDGRSGYYEEARVSEEDLAQITHAGVRRFYEQQNELLDGWREVDEVLESQFPTEVMRRFSTPGSSSRVHDHRNDSPGQHRNIDDLEEGCVTDDEGEPLWSHAFAHHPVRRGRRISERALTSLSGMLAKERHLLRGNSSVELAAESLQDLSTSAMVSQSYREHMSLADLLEHPEMERRQRESSRLQGAKESRPKTPKRNKSLLRRMLQENPAVDPSHKSYGTLDESSQLSKTESEEAPTIRQKTGEVSSTSPELTAKKPTNDRSSNMVVWTKADHERDQLLQNVPTHQRKQDSDAVVQFYINSTCEQGSLKGTNVYPQSTC